MLHPSDILFQGAKSLFYWISRVSAGAFDNLLAIFLFGDLLFRVLDFGDFLGLKLLDFFVLGVLVFLQLVLLDLFVLGVFVFFGLVLLDLLVL